MSRRPSTIGELRQCFARYQEWIRIDSGSSTNALFNNDALNLERVAVIDSTKLRLESVVTNLSRDW